MTSAAHDSPCPQRQASALASTFLQFSAILVVSLVAGSTFGIWRGYDPSGYSPETFLEVHQGAVRGLNLLLPILGAAGLAMIAALAFLGRARKSVLALYLATLLVLAVGGFAVTRFVNQPINEAVMAWTAGAMPSDWEELRDEWWRWHEVRTAASIAGAALLIAAVFADRGARRR